VRRGASAVGAAPRVSLLLRVDGVTIACPDCGTLEEIPRLLRRDTAVCIRCQTELEKTSGRSIGAALACSSATLLLLVPLNVSPLLRVDIFGMHSENITAAGVAELWGRGWIWLAGLSLLFVIVFPFLRFGLLSAVLGALTLGRRPSWLGSAFRWSMWLDPWAMVDVYLVAGCVGFYRLINIDQAHVTIELGGACFIAAAMLTMLSRATLDARTVWRAIGGRRTPSQESRCWAAPPATSCSPSPGKASAVRAAAPGCGCASSMQPPGRPRFSSPRSCSSSPPTSTR
jgi:paraquat-inducible protein A